MILFEEAYEYGLSIFSIVSNYWREWDPNILLEHMSLRCEIWLITDSPCLLMFVIRAMEPRSLYRLHLLFHIVLHIRQSLVFKYYALIPKHGVFYTVHMCIWYIYISYIIYIYTYMYHIYIIYILSYCAFFPHRITCVISTTISECHTCTHNQSRVPVSLSIGSKSVLFEMDGYSRSLLFFRIIFPTTKDKKAL